MEMLLISSRGNPLVKDYTRLRKSKNDREKSRRFVIEGVRLVSDALASGVKLENTFITGQALEKDRELSRLIGETSAKVYEITPSVAQKLADTQNPQGVFSTAFMLDKAFSLDTINVCGAYVALENIQDPGNMGAVLRTAEALGFGGVLFSQDCVDVYSPKVLRASMGAVFRLPLLKVENLPSALESLGRRGMKTVAAVAHGEAVPVSDIKPEGGVAAVIGNEGSGLTPECVSACGCPVTIPMKGRAESLNAAAAATILMWEIERQRRPETGK